MPEENENYRPKYPGSPFYHICDFVDKETGKTSREMNAEKTHQIPLGTLVEVRRTGVRLFVVFHYRDCDETPLYALCADKDDNKQERKGFTNSNWPNGYTEDGLKVVDSRPADHELGGLIQGTREGVEGSLRVGGKGWVRGVVVRQILDGYDRAVGALRIADKAFATPSWEEFYEWHQEYHAARHAEVPKYDNGATIKRSASHPEGPVTGVDLTVIDEVEEDENDDRGRGPEGESSP
jgi:hypothetical protein